MGLEINFLAGIFTSVVSFCRKMLDYYFKAGHKHTLFNS
jgi:hypothetical protein